MTTYGTDRIFSYYGNPETSSGFSFDKNQNYTLNSLHLAGIHLLLSMSIFISGVYLELQWLTEENCRTYYLMIYIRCGFWVITFIIDILITNQHNNLRREGYHDFYRKQILTYKNAPLSIVTLWNMIMFLVQTIMVNCHGSEFSLHCRKGVQSPMTYACIFCGFETILLMVLHGTYFIKVYHFNATHFLPDALRDIEQPFIGSFGITIENVRIVDLLEKQADLIYYHKEQNCNLKRKLLQLNQRSNKIGSYHKI